MGKIAMRLRRMTEVGRKNMLEIFCANTGKMQESQNCTVLKIKKRGKKHLMEETETGQNSVTALFYSLACGGRAWLTRHDENFRHFTYLK